jgi:hypothetical protein
MLSRREFLSHAASATATLLLTPIVIGACSDDGYGGSTRSTNPTTPGCDGVQPTSSVAASHTHTLCVPLRDLTSPPPGGVTYATSNTSEHTHTVLVSAEQLTAINTGSTVTVASSTDLDPLNGERHQHGFTIRRAAGATPMPEPAPTPPY